MTIVAAFIEFERIILVADCRVTFPDGQRHDALQKVYPLGSTSIVAFAGNVGLASSILKELTAKNRKRKSRKKRKFMLHSITRRLARIILTRHSRNSIWKNVWCRFQSN